MNLKPPSSHKPTILVVFGATGDLMAKKIVPALFHLYKKNKLPPLFKVIGFSRRNLSDSVFRASILEILSRHNDFSHQDAKKFYTFFSYAQGVFQQKAGYQALADTLKAVDDTWGMCSNKLFYLAVSPQYYEVIFNHLAGSGLTTPCSSEEGWSRVLVEKPFGKDLKTAQRMERRLSRLFKETQIYRIDHYLAKEMVQNIIAFRFSNNLFETTWDNHSIEKVEIRLWETIGVEERGEFYDGLGALRDVGQNHLLQMVALLAMEHPPHFFSDMIREKRSEILRTLVPPSTEEIRHYTFRAQYEGYLDIKGVASGSVTETYFKARAFLSHPRWEGVPFILESGKRMKEQIKEAVVTFHHHTPCLCPAGNNVHYKNKITISLEPEEKITLTFWSKKPGLDFELQERDFSFLMRGAGHKVQYTEEYEKLLYDCITGDQTLFVTSGEVEAMWKYTDPIIDDWQRNTVPLKIYRRGTDQPIIASRWINEEAALVEKVIKKEIGIVGLGKMGGNIARRLMEQGWRVHGFNDTLEPLRALQQEGILGVSSLQTLVEACSVPRIIWLMVPAGKPVDDTLFGPRGLVAHLAKGDVVIDGGNSFYKDSVRRSKRLKKIGIHFVDVGMSGGPEGARRGSSLMIGGTEEIFHALKPLFHDLAQRGGYQFFEGPGAGHFVKMVHNGIEYGMMQALAEGFTILKETVYKLDLGRVADVYNHGSVIESRLVDWLKKSFELHGKDLRNVGGSVGHTGEGEWTIKTANEMNIQAKIIEGALKFRIDSLKHPSYMGKILSALREQFGGHRVSNE